MDEDKIISAILDLSENIEKIRNEMLTEADGRAIQNILEGHTMIMKNIQEDHVFSLEWVKGLRESVEKQAKEIHSVKMHLNTT